MTNDTEERDGKTWAADRWGPAVRTDRESLLALLLGIDIDIDIDIDIFFNLSSYFC